MIGQITKQLDFNEKDYEDLKKDIKKLILSQVQNDIKESSLDYYLVDMDYIKDMLDEMREEIKCEVIDVIKEKIKKDNGTQEFVKKLLMENL